MLSASWTPPPPLKLLVLPDHHIFHQSETITLHNLKHLLEQPCHKITKHYCRIFGRNSKQWNYVCLGLKMA
jgi:hypothetical protein